MCIRDREPDLKPFGKGSPFSVFLDYNGSSKSSFAAKKSSALKPTYLEFLNNSKKISLTPAGKAAFKVFSSIAGPKKRRLRKISVTDRTSLRSIAFSFQRVLRTSISRYFIRSLKAPVTFSIKSLKFNRPLTSFLPYLSFENTGFQRKLYLSLIHISEPTRPY